MIPGPRFAMSPEDGRLMENLRRKLKVLKNSRYALGHNPENCTATQKEKFQLIQNSYGAYQMKEGLRLILHLSDASLARERLQRWCHDALNSGIDAFRDLGLKIEHHAVNIVNAIRCHANSSQSEATNTTIKALIRLARGFRNLDNLMSLVYLKCSDLVIPVKNMLQPSNEYQQAMRAQAAENRRQQARDKSDRLLEMKDRDPEADADMDHFGLGSGMAAEA